MRRLQLADHVFLHVKIPCRWTAETLMLACEFLRCFLDSRFMTRYLAGHVQAFSSQILVLECDVPLTFVPTRTTPEPPAKHAQLSSQHDRRLVFKSWRWWMYTVYCMLRRFAYGAPLEGVNVHSAIGIETRRQPSPISKHFRKAFSHIQQF